MNGSTELQEGNRRDAERGPGQTVLIFRTGSSAHILLEWLCAPESPLDKGED